MSGIFLCPVHGAVPLAPTSARIRALLDSGQPVPDNWVVMVVVQDAGGDSCHLVDAQQIEAAGLDPAVSPLLLRERDFVQKQLNDRLLIQRILRPTNQDPSGERHYTCRACLAAAIQPQGSPRFQLEQQAPGSVDGASGLA